MLGRIIMNNKSEIITINYYNENAEKFYNDTYNVAFSKIQNIFIKYLNSNAYILDFGCGSGRDSKVFMDKGFKVDALDGSIEMCKRAEKILGKKVLCQQFQDLHDVNKYDGIWACSSILHLEIQKLYDVFIRMRKALIVGGYLYTSFKYGNFSGFRNGRYFTDMTEDRLEDFLASVGGFETVEMMISSDVRPGREDEKWINIILRKSNIQ
jgi:SAM-dependent methyltransferase